MKNIFTYPVFSLLMFLCALAPAAEAAEIQRSYYVSGRVRKEVTVVDGRREGVTRIYYVNGNVKIEAHYKNDVLDGAVRTYYPDGKLEDEVLFQNGLPDGKAKRFLPDGNLLHVRFYEKGRLTYIENYRQGQKVGRKDFLPHEQTFHSHLFPFVDID
jgi:antitoxin component YwqK of YwqJK toxin-antitoxin module